MESNSNFNGFRASILKELKEKEILSAAKVREIHRQMTVDYPVGDRPGDNLLLMEMKILNKEILRDNLRIITGLDEDSGQSYYMLINRSTTSQECWKTLNVWNKNFKDSDRDFLKNIATEILKSPGRKRSIDKFGPVLKYIESETSVISRLLCFKWIQFNKENKTLSLGPRLIRQMKPWLQEELTVATCVCGVMVLRGILCICGHKGYHYKCFKVNPSVDIR